MNNKIKTNTSIFRQKSKEPLTKARSALKSGGVPVIDYAVDLSQFETQQLLNDLEVYKIELEMQNLELRLAIDNTKTAVEKYALLYDFAPSGYFTLTKRGEIIELNHCGAEMLGHPLSKLKSARLGHFISEDTRPIFNTFLDLIFKSQKKQMCEVTFSREGDLPLYVFLTGMVAENVDKCLVSALDITVKQQLVTETIRKSEQRFQTIFENVHDVFYQTDINGIILEISPSIKHHSEYCREELIGSSVSDIYANPGDRITLINAITKSGKLQDYELRIKSKTGKLKVVSLNAQLISDGEGKPLHIDGSMRDITRRNQAEDEVRKLQKAIENSKTSVVITDSNGNIEYANPFFSQLTGYSKEEYTGQNPRFLQSGHHSKIFYLEFWNTIKSGQTWEGEFCNKKKNGEYYWENAIISPIHNSKNEITHFIAIKTDISETKKINEELVKAKLHAEESDNLKTAFLNNISHEIRTPFNGILGFLSLLQEDDLTRSEKLEYTRIINESANRLMKTINDIAEISQIQAGQVKLTETCVNIGQLTIELVNRFQSEFQIKGLKFTIKNDLPKNLDHIYTDDIKINTILNNLLSNAIKFTQAGYIKLTIKLINSTQLEEAGRDRAGLVSNPYNIQFSVKDTGIGIPENKQKVLFKPFMQVDGSNTRKYEGSGLGTSIAKAYVEILGGTISVESKEGKGSVFRFTIPYHTESNEDALIKDNLMTQPIDKATLQKVLIVEDDEASQILLEYTIKPFSKAVLIARTGVEAIETFRNNRDIDLIFMDIKMPEMDGYEATRQIRQYDNQVIIIAQTAYALSDDIERAIASGCTDYITKPIRKDHLLALVQKYF